MKYIAGVALLFLGVACAEPAPTSSLPETFLDACESDDDCVPPMACVSNDRGEEPKCTSSCQQVEDCEEAIGSDCFPCMAGRCEGSICG